MAHPSRQRHPDKFTARRAIGLAVRRAAQEAGPIKHPVIAFAASPRRVGGRGLSPAPSRNEAPGGPLPILIRRSPSPFPLSPFVPPTRPPSPRRPGRGGRNPHPDTRAAGRSLCVTALDG